MALIYRQVSGVIHLIDEHDNYVELAVTASKEEMVIRIMHDGNEVEATVLPKYLDRLVEFFSAIKSEVDQL